MDLKDVCQTLQLAAFLLGFSFGSAHLASLPESQQDAFLWAGISVAGLVLSQNFLSFDVFILYLC
jgi:hypothetical protein